MKQIGRASKMGHAVVEEQIQSHEMVRRGPVAFCKCGAWECRTNEVVEADIINTLQRQHSLHLMKIDKVTHNV